jgi:hypothetical protein
MRARKAKLENLMVRIRDAGAAVTVVLHRLPGPASKIAARLVERVETSQSDGPLTVPGIPSRRVIKARVMALSARELLKEARQWLRPRHGAANPYPAGYHRDSWRDVTESIEHTAKKLEELMDHGCSELDPECLPYKERLRGFCTNMRVAYGGRKPAA